MPWALHDLGEAARHVGAAQLPRRDVEADVRVQPQVRPRARLRADLGQHPVPERLDHARALGDGDELARRDQPLTRGIAPAHERLDADHAAVGEPQDRLVVQLELAALDPAPQPRGQLEPRDRVDRAVAVDGDPAACRLRLVHGGVRVLAQRLGRLGVVREQADADGGVDQQLGRAELERRVHRVGDPLPDRLGRLAPRRRQVADQDQELVAALAHHQVAGPHRLAQALARPGTAARRRCRARASR